MKAITGLVSTKQCFGLEDVPNEEEEIIPVKEVYKCKIDQDGNIDKLKARVVFRGDLYAPSHQLDSWNPHADSVALRIFLAICARFGMFPSQSDLVMAYIPVKMRERVFVKFPALWAKVLPERFQPYVNRPLPMLKALYGFNYSGKFLFEEQAEFFDKQELKPCAAQPSGGLAQRLRGCAHRGCSWFESTARSALELHSW